MRRALLNQNMQVPIVPGSDGVCQAEQLDENSKVVSISEARAIKQPTYLVDEDDFIIVAATPLSLSVNKTEKGNIATLAWLCKSKSSKLFTFCTNYLLETDEEIEELEELPFHDKDKFISQLVANDMLMRELPSFVSDMQFSSTVDKLKENKQFTIQGTSVSKSGIGQIATFTVSNDIFASFVFVDNYIYDNIINNYELTLSISNIAIEKEKVSDIFVISNINSIISMAGIDKKSNSIALTIKVINIDKEINTLLCPFNIGVKFDKKKFKGITTKDLEDSFGSDADQFIHVFIATTRIKNLDKEYLIIKAINKNKESKLFFLDNDIRTQLETMIRDY